MDSEHVAIGLVSMMGAIITATAIATAYLSRQIDIKLTRSDYEAQHKDLQIRVEELNRDMNLRVRELELWAAKQGYRNGQAGR